MHPPLVNDPAAPLIAAGGLSKRYRRSQAVTGLSLAVHGGEVCALLGPNGAGKTSTMRMLAGLSRPDEGSVRLLGEPVRLGAPVLRRPGSSSTGPRSSRT
jgi:ABC-type multidrug transport system ATPase subunit